jgi:two-component system sensor histidine kinase AlgZ
MKRKRSWTRMIGLTVAAAAAVILVFGRFGGHTTARALLADFGVALTFSACIAIPLSYLMPRVAPKLFCALPFPWHWAAIVAVMITTAMIGSSLAIGVLIGVGYLRGGQFSQWFLASFRTSVITTLTFGLGVTAYESMRARLDATAAALRRQEREGMEAQRLATEARLASLESRVRPHFLFNTLNSIAALIPEDPEGAERMTGQLASLLRSSLDAGGRRAVPLGQELETVRTYLEIERVRFGDRLQYVIETDESAERALVPPMSVQTVVENSVKYAISPRRSGGSIAVRALVRDHALELEVSDDGPGFDESAMVSGHGLALLRDRLAMSFGEAASLSLDRRAGGMLVRLRLPA